MDKLYLRGLNPAQLEAAQSIEGPLLILACAGTGKTRTLTARIANLLDVHGVKPQEIMAVTFTNKAAKEMMHQVSRHLDEIYGNKGDNFSHGYGYDNVSLPYLGTFHSIALKFLRLYPTIVGLKPNFSVIDRQEQERLIKQLSKSMNIDEKQVSAKKLAWLLDDAANRGLMPDDLTSSDDVYLTSSISFADFYGFFSSQLEASNSIDFGTILVKMLKLLSNDEILPQIASRAKYIMVDEYQDTNQVQYLWLKRLGLRHSNICCVGDDDQSIYSWRGAEVENILRFTKDFPEAHTIKLEVNYRSQKTILEAAGYLISNNSNRLEKTIKPHKSDTSPLILRSYYNDEEEASSLADTVMLNMGKGVNYEDQAILVRASHQMRVIEDQLVAHQLPYRVIGAPRFYDRLEIRDCLAFCKLALSLDNSMAFERALNCMKRGFGVSSFQKLANLANYEQISYYQAAQRLLESGGFKRAQSVVLAKFLSQIESWAAQMEQYDSLDACDFFENMMEESGYKDKWQQEKTVEADARIDNMKELSRAIGNFSDLLEFVEHVTLFIESDSFASENSLSLMTLHASKGLEFDTIFLPGWEEGLFPNQRTLEEGGLKAIEEERRLAYVGLTRARCSVFISYAGSRRFHGSYQSSAPSRFVGEIPKHCFAPSDNFRGGGYARNFGNLPRSQGGTSGSAGFKHRGSHGNFGNSSSGNFNGSGFNSGKALRDMGVEVVGRDDLESRLGGINSNSDLVIKKGKVFREARQVATASSLKSRTRSSSRVDSFKSNFNRLRVEELQFSVGEPVFHRQFGEGVVSRSEGTKIWVRFRDHGEKILLSSFLSRSGSG